MGQMLVTKIDIFFGLIAAILYKIQCFLFIFICTHPTGKTNIATVSRYRKDHVICGNNVM